MSKLFVYIKAKTAAKTAIEDVKSAKAAYVEAAYAYAEAGINIRCAKTKATDAINAADIAKTAYLKSRGLKNGNEYRTDK
ncbi:MAG: hypothetical protein GY829_13225 [Gammaproteobacteria bacterium]|nr:hypothetical protein [Gammaproteobacteria bacterium]